MGILDKLLICPCGCHEFMVILWDVILFRCINCGTVYRFVGNRAVREMHYNSDHDSFSQGKLFNLSMSHQPKTLGYEAVPEEEVKNRTSVVEYKFRHPGIPSESVAKELAQDIAGMANELELGDQGPFQALPMVEQFLKDNVGKKLHVRVERSSKRVHKKDKDFMNKLKDI